MDISTFSACISAPGFPARLKKKFAGWIENANKYGIHIDN